MSALRNLLVAAFVAFGWGLVIAAIIIAVLA